jgi:folate-binding Fe-S cluster repair protein YgfZ
MLKVYRLRRKVDIAPIKMDVGFAIEPTNGCLADPRAVNFGHRILGESSGQNNEMDYLYRRLEWGIPEGVDELTDQIPLNANGDIMNGINFDKGLSTLSRDY